MSEYQYYEFRTIHRHLTPAQRAEVAKLSSHGDTTSTSFSVDYSYGDFKHNPQDVLARYFDAFFYIANWGSAQLMFRFPKGVIDTRSLEPFCIQGQVTVDYKLVADSLILSFNLNEEEGYDWVEDSGQLSGVLGLYDAILNGDLRALYLAWLGAIDTGVDDEDEFDDETLEPPVPPNLASLSTELEAFVEMFGIDQDLIEVAAKTNQATTTAQADSGVDIEALPAAERDDFIRRLLQGEENLASKLRLRLRELQPNAIHYEPTGTRTVGELLAGRQQIAQVRKQAAEADREAARRAKMAELAARGDSAWQEVERLIEAKNSEGYKNAAILLQQLGELATEQKQERIFFARLEQIRTLYSRRSGFMRELRQRNL